jgi:hypothetical protein
VACRAERDNRWPLCPGLSDNFVIPRPFTGGCFRLKLGIAVVPHALGEE